MPIDKFKITFRSTDESSIRIQAEPFGWPHNGMKYFQKEQNYEQPPQTYQNYDFQCLKLVKSFPKKLRRIFD
jgi:hypothetical protein